ncbi:MAG: tail fiber protein [Chitinophagaceae bacterium]|jgi:microcystin-dependent protein|nr:tail fiber protein [Chitinophagaceae bacterium]
MSQPYIGEIRLFCGNFAPAGWLFCQGQLLSISENETLFNLIGTTYGGDGESTFAIPDLRGRAPLHAGSLGGTNYVLAETGGVEMVTLNQAQIPAHRHVPLVANTGTSDNPAGNVWAASGSRIYNPTLATGATMSQATVGFTGGSQPHENRQPYLAISYIISLFGVFPTQN